MSEHRSSARISHDVAPGSPIGGGAATLLSPKFRSGRGDLGSLFLVDFEVDGVPAGQPRPRFRRNGGVYTPPGADAWKVAVIMAARRHRPPAFLEGPVSCRLVLRFPRPKSHYIAGESSRGLKANAPFWHTAKPDADNVAKATLDALQHAGIWRDDAQVAELMVSKCYSDNPGAFIHLEERFAPERGKP